MPLSVDPDNSNIDMEHIRNFLEKIKSNILMKIFLILVVPVGTILAIITFFQEKDVDLQYEIISYSNVLDINAEVSKLDIIYDSISLKENHENLRLFNIKIINQGEKDILFEYYDPNDPFGVKVDSGKILENPEIIETSSDYLERNLKFSQPNDYSITFSEVILEKGEYFILKILVQHKITVEPHITSIGKIAGQKEIKVKLSSEVKDESPFLITTFFGNIWVQLTRFLGYSIVFVLILIMIAFISSKFYDRKTNRRRSKIINKFKTKRDYKYIKMDDAIFDRYYESGPYDFELMLELTSSSQYLNDEYQKSITALKQEETNLEDMKQPKLLHIKDEAEMVRSAVRSMLTDGLVFLDFEKLAINHKMRQSLSQFVELLKDEKEIGNEILAMRDKMINEGEEDIK